MVKSSLSRSFSVPKDFTRVFSLERERCLCLCGPVDEKASPLLSPSFLPLEILSLSTSLPEPLEKAVRLRFCRFEKIDSD